MRLTVPRLDGSAWLGDDVPVNGSARATFVTSLIAVATVSFAGCSTESPPPSLAPPSTQSPSAVAPSSPSKLASDVALVGDYASGLAAELRVPHTTGPATLVVVVPGGGWATAEPDYLVPFAQALTTAGNTTSLITYSTTWAGARFPQPADDVACAVRWSAQKAADLGYPPSQVVVAGHSAGGHLATLVALSGDQFGEDCSAPPVAIDGVIGMSGVYDSNAAIDGLDVLFEGSDTAESRALGSPLEWAHSDSIDHGNLRVLLLHGADDAVVSVAEAENLAAALESAKVDVELAILPKQKHDIPTTSKDVVPAIIEWLRQF